MAKTLKTSCVKHCFKVKNTLYVNRKVKYKVCCTVSLLLLYDYCSKTKNRFSMYIWVERAPSAVINAWNRSALSFHISIIKFKIIVLWLWWNFSFIVVQPVGYNLCCKWAGKIMLLVEAFINNAYKWMHDGLKNSIQIELYS